MQFMALTTFVKQCRSTTDPVELWQSVLGFFHSHRIDMVSYQNEDVRFPYVTRPGHAEHGFPETWVSQYLSRNRRHADPMPAVAAQHLQPFRWSEVGSLKALTPAEQAFMRDLEASGIGDGLAIQVYGPKNRNAYVGLGLGPAPRDLSAEEILELQCAAQVAHVQFCGLSPDQAPLASGLSPRELEVLRWIARGKSNTVIADILGISRHTVDTMMRRLFEKLNVNDRTTAAIRGLGVGLLRYSGSEVV